MKTFDANIKEKTLVQLLQKLGYTHLSPDEALQMQGDNLTRVLLEPVLREQIKRINGNIVSDADVEEAIQALYTPPLEDGYLAANKYIYYLLRQGKLVDQNRDIEQGNYHIHYIDWEYPANNQFHIVDNYPVAINGQKSAFQPDIVLFINGIPVSIVESKTSHKQYDRRSAVAQHLRNQLPDGIRELYIFSQILFSLTNDCSWYGTNASPAERWQTWKELYPREACNTLQKLTDKEPTQQEELLYNMARPERLLNLMRRFVIYTNREKIIARSHQYFVVQGAMERIREMRGNARRGGMIWHTQGSGKSLTMLMLAQAILLDKTIDNPKIVLLTDRRATDHQLTDTFRNCGTYIENATTGKMLADLLENKTDTVVSTVVQKFEPALKQINTPLDSPNIFFLVDDAHRIQNTLFKDRVQHILPNACFIGFTGLPFTVQYKAGVNLFDEEILPVYTFKEAIGEGVSVPLRYEERVIERDNFQQYTSDLISRYRIMEIAKDISDDFRIKSKDKKGSFKGLLACSDTTTAILYKKHFDETGSISTEVFIGLQPEKENELQEIRDFRNQILDTYGSMGKYQESSLYRFSNSSHPELLIVVDMLLTGFDEPKNSVLYIDRFMENYLLLQAVARVNRVFPGKDCGYIVDYYGISDSVKKLLTMEPGDENLNYINKQLTGELVIAEKEADNISQYPVRLKQLKGTTGNISIPAELNHNTYASACYRMLRKELKNYKMSKANREKMLCAISLESDRIVRNRIYEDGLMIVDWPTKIDIRRTLTIELQDYMADRVRPEFNLDLSWEDIDKISEKWVDLATDIYV